MKKNLLNDEYPSNSKNVVEKKEVKKLTKGAVIQKDRGVGTNFREVFFSEDSSSVSSYLIYEVLIPSIKNALSELITGGVDMALFGNRGGRSSREYSGSKISYSSISSGRSSRATFRDSSRNASRVVNTKDYIFETRDDANIALDQLCNMVEEYGQATVADLCDIIGVTAQYTDVNWGWVDLGRARITKYRGSQYMLILPKVEVLDD